MFSRRRQCNNGPVFYPRRPHNNNNDNGSNNDKNGEKKSDQHGAAADDSTNTEEGTLSTMTDALFGDLPSWLEDLDLDESSDNFVPDQPTAEAARPSRLRRGKHVEDCGDDKDDEAVAQCEPVCAGSFFPSRSPPLPTLASISETATTSAATTTTAPKLTVGSMLEEDISDYDMFVSTMEWDDIEEEEADDKKSAEKKKKKRQQKKKKKTTTQILGSLRRRYIQRRTTGTSSQQQQRE